MDCDWQEIVAQTLVKFVKSRSAQQITRRANLREEPDEFLGEIFLGILRSERCAREFPTLARKVIEKRVWTLAQYQLRNSVRATFSRALRATADRIPSDAHDTELIPTPVFEQPDPYEDFDLSKAVSALAEPLKSVVTFHLQSKPLSEIAVSTGANVGTVSRQLKRAIQILRQSACQN